MSYNEYLNCPIITTKSYLDYFRYEINTPYVIFRTGNNYEVNVETLEETYDPTYIELNNIKSTFFCSLEFLESVGSSGILIEHDKITFPDNSVLSSFNLASLNDVLFTNLTAGQLLAYNGFKFINVTKDTAVGYALPIYLTNTASSVEGYKVISSHPSTEPQVAADLADGPLSFLSEPFNKTSFNKGVWSFRNYIELSAYNVNDTITIGLYIYKEDTSLVTISSNINVPINNTTDVQEVITEYLQSADIPVAVEDRLLVVFTYSGSNSCLLYFQGNSHASRFTSPFMTNHNDMLGIQGGADNEMYHLNEEEYNDIQNREDYITISDNETATYPDYVKIDFLKIETL